MEIAADRFESSKYKDGLHTNRIYSSNVDPLWCSYKCMVRFHANFFSIITLPWFSVSRREFAAPRVDFQSEEISPLIESKLSIGPEQRTSLISLFVLPSNLMSTMKSDVVKHPKNVARFIKIQDLSNAHSQVSRLPGCMSTSYVSAIRQSTPAAAHTHKLAAWIFGCVAFTRCSEGAASSAKRRSTRAVQTGN